MYFELFENQKLRVVLSAADLQRYELTYEAIDYADSKTRTALLHVLELARQKTGYAPAVGRLLVEVYPLLDGCIVYFSCGLHEEESGILEPVVFTFACCEDMIAACTKTFALCSHRIRKSSLYSLDGRYRLVLYPLDGVNSLSAAFLCEYARPSGRGAVLAAFLAEHAIPIAEENAIDKISYFLS